VPALSREEKLAALQEVAAEVAVCVQCPLHRGRNKTVPGEGDPDAEVMFIGEAPGWHENQQGRPFVGPAGQFLEELLRSVGLTRRDVWIGNVVKCRPPDNRDPDPAEIDACAGYLERQIAIIDPRVIVTLGRFSMAKFFPGEKVSRIHGQARRSGNRMVMAMYHPAAALHQASLRRVVEQDFLKLPAVVAEARKLSAAAEAEQAEAAKAVQLSLF
jgi:DNA polymerase